MQPQQSQKTYFNNERPFDQKPIGFSQKAQQMSEYPPDFNPNDVNLDKKPQPLPLAKRLHSKVWKIRKEAFQQLLTEVTEKGQIYQQYLKDTVQFITDANPMCQQRALKVLLKYLQNAKKSFEDPKPILKALIEKCLVVQKGQSSSLTTQIMFWFMDNYLQILLNEVSENILNKNPKIAASILSFLQKLLNNYGAKKLKQFQQFNKNFTLLSSSVRPIAKQQSIGLFKQMYKWMGDATFGFNMHPQVKQQVVKFSKTYMKQPMIIKRGLNQQQKKGKKPITQSADDDQNDQPQDVLLPYDSRWVDKILQQPKWKEKKSLLDEFIKKTKVKNIISRDNTHYITLIKRLLSDNNINLLQCGFKVVKNLCNGLKKNFTHPSRVVLQLIFSKLRDTKAMIVDQAQQTLESMMNSIVLDDMIQQIKEGLKDKAPNMRFQTLKFIQKLICKRDKKMMGAFKNLTIQIVDLNQDGASQVRDKALDVLCKLKSVYGLNFFGDKLKKIQGKKLQTIQNYIDPNENKIEQQPIEEQQSRQLSRLPDKKSIKTYSPKDLKYEASQSQPLNSSKQSLTITEPIPKANPFPTFSQFQSPNQNTRFLAYQNLSSKSSQVITSQLIQAFKNKTPMIRQSNPTILKLILACVKKTVQNTVGIQHMELLMYHDWKKCKQLLVQFVQTSKLNLMALEYVKNTGLLQVQNGQNKRSQHVQKPIERQIGNSNSQHTNLHHSNQHLQSSNINPLQTSSVQSLKTFYSSIPNLIPKISNPDPNVRLQSVQIALQLLKPIPIGTPLQSSIQPLPAITESMSQLFNVLKYRIQDSNQQICNNYIILINQMLSKGFLTKYRTPGRLIISTLLQKINNSRLTNLTAFVNQMVTNHAVILWQFLVTQLNKQNLCNAVLNIIKNNNQSFFKYADQKAYILPLITCIAKDVEGQRCGELLDQIVQINGQQSLEKVIKESKISGFSLENYLKKWHIHTNNNPTSNNQKGKSLQNSISINLNFAHSKLQRLSSQVQNSWPLTPSPTHILKMLTQMMNLGEPFHSLSSPTLLTEQQLSIINNIKSQLIQDYSDILTKWIFWRVHIQGSSKNIQTLLDLVYKMISLGFELHQSQIVTILGTLISCLTLHKLQFMKSIIKISSYLNQHPLYKQKSFRFWINSFNDPTAPVDQILNLITHSCADMIPSQLVTLARYPSVIRNKQFNAYLRSNYTQKLLTVYGFKLQDISKTQQKQLISQNLNIQILTQVQAKYFIQLFQRMSSGQLVQKIAHQTESISTQFVMQAHLKIMHAIILPYLHRQLSFINVYNYFKYVQKIMPTVNCSPFLLNLVRTLSYFLIDLDQLKLQNYSQLLKTINKLLLILLQVSQPKHILQVLFLMIKQQLKTNGYIKLNLLLPKCIGKVIKNPIFRSQYDRQRNGEGSQFLQYIIKQFMEILCGNQISQQSSLMKTIKNLFCQIISIFPNSLTIFEDILKQNSQKIPQKINNYIKQLIQDKIKQNNNNNTQSQKPQISFVNSQNSYVQSKDIKNAGNMMKALKSVVGQHGISNNGKRNLEKMDE